MKKDQWLLLALKFVRMVAYGQTTMILVPFLLSLNSTDSQVGLFMTLTLIGDVVLSSYITFTADKFGRRYMLGTSAVLMILSGVAFMFSSNYWLLLTAAIFGVISPSGDEVGPFRAIEEATIAHITPEDKRATVFAAQNLFGTLGLAIGSLSGGFLVDFFTKKAGKVNDAYRVVFFCYVLCAVCNLVISAILSEETEIIEAFEELDAEAAAATINHNANANANVNGNSNSNSNSNQTPDSYNGYRNLALTLCSFFGIDSLAYGFMPNSWLVEYLMRQFNSPSTIVGLFFFASTFISAATSFPSAWFTDYVGPVAAISLTKLGAGLFGALVPTASKQMGAMSYIWMRSLFDTMDVVPRQVFLTSIIEETERTKILGMVNVTKTLARAIGPIFTGMLAGAGHLDVCFYIMGALEWVFAGAVYVVFAKSERSAGPLQI
ncbi:hypothetical protein DASB73_008680 [Starmerella bacillaris]|uniref:Major facilitator superfamily (MFS) profile domain-containing protein n=1 Tax=Starmerella bacillaris TaxID=1247836 RepID=A0AAV5RES7_STABA|nr:hypothetical protein DASB73_008680 [Starmerella bacillaris]